MYSLIYAFPDSCSAKQIPESILIDEFKELLELNEFDEEIFNRQIRQIYIKENSHLEFLFHDGKVVEKNWQYKSRSESWTEEKRKLARDKNLGRRKQPCEQQEQ